MSAAFNRQQHIMDLRAKYGLCVVRDPRCYVGVKPAVVWQREKLETRLEQIARIIQVTRAFEKSWD